MSMVTTLSTAADDRQEPSDRLRRARYGAQRPRLHIQPDTCFHVSSQATRTQASVSPFLLTLMRSGPFRGGTRTLRKSLRQRIRSGALEGAIGLESCIRQGLLRFALHATVLVFGRAR